MRSECCRGMDLSMLSCITALLTHSTMIFQLSHSPSIIMLLYKSSITHFNNASIAVIGIDLPISAVFFTRPQFTMFVLTMLINSSIAASVFTPLTPASRFTCSTHCWCPSTNWFADFEPFRISPIPIRFLWMSSLFFCFLLVR